MNTAKVSESLQDSNAGPTHFQQELGEETSYLKTIWRRFLKHHMAVTGAVVFLLIVLMAVLAPWLAPTDPNRVDPVSFQSAPSAAHILGTDDVGRDVLSRLLYAARVSLSVGLGAVAIYVMIGTLIGAVAGFFGGWIDGVLMRITDIFMSFPYLMVILVLVSVMGPSLTNIIVVLGVLGWPQVARIVRGSVLQIKQMDYVRAAVALGYSAPRIVFSHILPNAFAPILVNATFGMASAIITESSLSFLGMGVQPPTASWGNMLTQAQSLTVLSSQPWMWLPSGFMIVIAVLSINFMGDGLRDAVDPKSFR